jgi:hypothetical protein
MTKLTRQEALVIIKEELDKFVGEINDPTTREKIAQRMVDNPQISNLFDVIIEDSTCPADGGGNTSPLRERTMKIQKD